MVAFADQLDEPAEVDLAGGGHQRLRRTAPAHGDDDWVEVAAYRGPSQLGRDRRLPGPLAGPDDCDRRRRERWSGDGRIETEVGPEIGQAPDQRHGGKLHPFVVTEHRLVR